MQIGAPVRARPSPHQQEKGDFAGNSLMLRGRDSMARTLRMKR